MRPAGPRAALLPILTLAPMLLAPMLLAPMLACGGDRAPASSGDTAAGRAAGATTTATADGSTYGGDTALAPATLPSGRPGAQAAVAGQPGAAGTATAAPGAPGAPGATGTAATAPAQPATATPTGLDSAASGAPGTMAAAPGASGTSSAPATPAAAAPTPAQVPAAAVTPRAASGRAHVPFAPQERMEFDVKFGAIDVGDAAMQVNGIVPVRGHETYHTVFRVSGGTLFFKVNDRYESWIDTRTLSSHRHVQQIDEGSYERERVYEIYQDRGVYRENRKPEQKTVDEPLDDGSFFYFVRTIPLEVGKTYTFDRYFKPDRNPVTIKVLRKERVKVPAGTFDAVVIQPLIKTKGVFGEGGRAEIWLADDSTRAMLQMKSQLKFGSLNLYLKKYRPGTRPAAP